MIDIAGQLTATYREITPGMADSASGDAVDTGGTTEAVGVVLRRRYSYDIGEVWSAVTEPKHLRRWFGTVIGCHQRNDGFTVAEQGSGRVLCRETPHLLQLTWGAENTAVVTVRMAPDENNDTVVELTHTARIPEPDSAGSGPGCAERSPVVATALTEGTMWDFMFLALQHHLDGSEIEDPRAWRRGPDVQKFAQHSVSAWVKAVEVSGIVSAPTADDGSGGADPIADAVRNCLRRFAPELTG